MKLYVSADMEGTAGVSSWRQVDPNDTHEYPLYRRYMTREVRAAIDGARAAGVADVTINDSHWDKRNLLWDELPNDVRMITGTPKPLSMVQGIASDFSGAFFTGYHGMAGDADAVLSHTYSPETIYNISVNGVPCSEALLNAAMLGIYGVPLLMITGDRATVEATKKQLPWVTAVVVKESIGYNAVNTLTPAAACDAIRVGAQNALRRIAEAKPFTFEPPVELIIETARVENADFIELMPGFERLGGRTVRYVASEYSAIFRAFLVATRLGGAANVPS